MAMWVLTSSFTSRATGTRTAGTQQQRTNVGRPDPLGLLFVHDVAQAIVIGQAIDLGSWVWGHAGVDKPEGWMEVADDIHGDFDKFLGWGRQTPLGRRSPRGDFGIGKDAIGQVIDQLALGDFA
jgi:hypothetical protein